MRPVASACLRVRLLLSSAPARAQNYKGSWRMHGITLGNATMVEFKASFNTEAELAGEMHASIRELCCVWMEGFQAIGRPTLRQAPQLQAGHPTGPPATHQATGGSLQARGWALPPAELGRYDAPA